MQKSKEDCGAIRALREALKDDIIGLIIEQRLNFVCKGTFFIKPIQSRKTTYTYMKLSQNKKTICYGDFPAKSQNGPEMEDLTGKILISDIRDFGAGMISHTVILEHFNIRCHSTTTHCQFSGFSFILFLVIFLLKYYATKFFFVKLQQTLLDFCHLTIFFLAWS